MAERVTNEMMTKQKDKVILNLNGNPSVMFVRGFAMEHRRNNDINVPDPHHLSEVMRNVEESLENAKKRLTGMINTGINSEMKTCIKALLLNLKQKLQTENLDISGWTEALLTDMGELNRVLDNTNICYNYENTNTSGNSNNDENTIKHDNTNNSYKSNNPYNTNIIANTNNCSKTNSTYSSNDSENNKNSNDINNSANNNNTYNSNFISNSNDSNNNSSNTKYDNVLTK